MLRVSIGVLSLAFALAGCKGGKKDSSDTASSDDKSVEGSDEGEEEDDFVVAESSSYISGTNLLEATASVVEIGGRGRIPEIAYDSATKKVSGTLPDDGYFVIQVGDKYAVVGPSGDGIKVALRRYHGVTAQLLRFAVEGAGKDLFDQAAVDLGAFAYAGETVYRASRRNPALLAEGSTLLADLAAKLVERNLQIAQARGVDVVASAFKDAYKAAHAETVVARLEGPRYRSLSAGVADPADAQGSVLKAAVDFLAGSGEASHRDVLNEMAFVDAVANLNQIGDLAPQVAEDLQIDVWRTIQDVDGAAVSAAASSGSVPASLSPVVDGVVASGGDQASVVSAVFKNRRWRRIPAPALEAYTVVGGHLVANEGGTYFFFLGQAKGTDTVNLGLMNLYVSRYRNGKWQDPQQLEEGLVPAGYLVGATCDGKGCVISVAVEGSNPQGVGDAVDAAALDDGGAAGTDSVQFGYFGFEDGYSPMTQLGSDSHAVRILSDGSLAVSVVQDEKLVTYRFAGNGKLLSTETKDDARYATVYSQVFDGVTVLEAATIEAGDTRGHRILVGDAGAFVVLKGVSPYASLENVDLRDGHLVLSYLGSGTDADGRYVSSIVSYATDGKAVPKYEFSTQPRTSELAQDGTKTRGFLSGCVLDPHHAILTHSLAEGTENRLYVYKLDLPAKASDLVGQVVEKHYAITAVLDCSYQQALFWRTRLADGASEVKVLNIDDSGAFLAPETILTVKPKDKALLGLGTASSPFGLRTAMVLRSTTQLHQDVATAAVDVSRVSFHMYLFE